MPQSTLRVEARTDRVIAVLDRPQARNAIDQELVDELHAVCAQLEAVPRVLILAGSDGVFASGADIAQLRERTAADAREGINMRVFTRIAELPMPVIAAVDGWALGGGAELAFAADIRIGTPRTRIGSPETGLGIMPAAGATFRLPAIVGHARAAELLLTGRVLDAAQALAWGILSSVHEPDALMDAAHALADRIAANDPLATRYTKRALAAPRDAHPEIEYELQAELFERPEKRERMTAFLGTAGPAMTTVPKRVGVIGGGRMGAGITHAFLMAGAAVHVVEQEATVAGAESRVRGLLQGSRDRGMTVPADATLSVGTDASAFAGCGLVIEAVPEEPTLKAQALTRAEAALGERAVLASNTSSLSIGELAAALDRPDRFLGMHFFNPVPSSKLVEVVTGPATADTVRAQAVEWIEALGKTPIVVQDAPGFASSRLGVALGLEAIRMLEEGVASAADIDTAMRLGYGHPVGPLRTTDIVGLDVRLAIATELSEKLGDRFAPPELMRRMVAEGRLGRKSGQGFYEWSEG